MQPVCDCPSSFALLAFAGAAYAQETTGRIIGRVSRQGQRRTAVRGDRHRPGPARRGRDDHRRPGRLPVHVAAARHVHASGSTSPTRRRRSSSRASWCAAEKTVRANAKISGAVQEQAQQTYVITGKVPPIDIGSTRIAAQFDESYTRNVPTGRNYGDVIQRAPGAFIDAHGQRVDRRLHRPREHLHHQRPQRHRHGHGQPRERRPGAWAAAPTCPSSS